MSGRGGGGGGGRVRDGRGPATLRFAPRHSGGGSEGGAGGGTCGDCRKGGRLSGGPLSSHAERSRPAPAEREWESAVGGCCKMPHPRRGRRRGRYRLRWWRRGRRVRGRGLGQLARAPCRQGQLWCRARAAARTTTRRAYGGASAVSAHAVGRRCGVMRVREKGMAACAQDIPQCPFRGQLPGLATWMEPTSFTYRTVPGWL